MSSGIFQEAVFGVIWMKIKSIFSPYRLNQNVLTGLDLPEKSQ